MSDLGPRNDPEVRDPRAPLGVVLVLLRALSGRRGTATVHWEGAGFRYTLTARRTRHPGSGVGAVDTDPTAPEHGDLLARLRAALSP